MLRRCFKLQVVCSTTTKNGRTQRSLVYKKQGHFIFVSLAQSRLSPLRSQWTPLLFLCFHPFPPRTPFVDQHKEETLADDIIKLPAALNNNCALPLPETNQLFLIVRIWLPHLHTVCSKHAAFLHKSNGNGQDFRMKSASSLNESSSIDLKKTRQKKKTISDSNQSIRSLNIGPAP